MVGGGGRARGRARRVGGSTRRDSLRRGLPSPSRISQPGHAARSLIIIIIWLCALGGEGEREMRGSAL
eukprot:1375442-Rhodomonas_salina.1